MKTLRCILAISVLLCVSSCEDKFYKEKYDIDFFITNKTNHTIHELTIDGGYGAKTWTLKDLDPEKTERLRINIKRELRIPEGGFVFSAVTMNGDSLSLSTGYFTNWYYALPNPTIIFIYDDRIEIEK